MSRTDPHVAEPAGVALAQLRAQVIEQARREAAPTRAQLFGRHAALMIVSALFPLLIFVAIGGVRAAPRPPALVLETALGSVLLALLVASAGLSRGRSMLGRPRAWLVSVVVLTPLSLFAWRVLSGSRYPDMMRQWSSRPGLRCFLLSCALSVVPLLGVLWMRRGSMPANPRLTAAGVAAAVGAGVWVLVDLWCPVGYVPHLLFGHVLPLALLMALSALVGSRLFES
jgi:hypothetical protein